MSRPAFSRAATESAASRGFPEYISGVESFIEVLLQRLCSDAGRRGGAGPGGTTVTVPLSPFQGSAHVTTYQIAVIGGTGPQGKGLAYRFAKHGHRVVLGSRAAAGAEPAAADLRARLA
ncbi:MAG: NAD(P)-binding domain-containing protein, partial [Nocardioidaceae bacterium]